MARAQLVASTRLRTEEVNFASSRTLDSPDIAGVPGLTHPRQEEPGARLVFGSWLADETGLARTRAYKMKDTWTDWGLDGT